MSKHEGPDLMRTLANAFQDAHLETGRCNGIPSNVNETARSSLFQIIDSLSPEIWENPSTSIISKEVILTLLQCAARLYEGGVLVQEAIDLIDNEDTRAILRLGIQDNLSNVINQRCIESIRANKFEVTNAENCSQQAGLFSAIRKNDACQLNHQAMIIEHISALCRIHGSALQNDFDSPRIDEPFMFRNYVTLSKNFNICEKSWLVTLLPDIFQWENQVTSGSNDILVTPNLTRNKDANQDVNNITSEADTSPQDTQGISDNTTTLYHEPVSLDGVDRLCNCSWGLDACTHVSNGNLVSPPSHDSEVISSELQSCITICAYKDIQDAFNFIDSSTLMRIDKAVQPRPGNQHSPSELSPYTNKIEVYNKWIKNLWQGAITYRNLASFEAVISVLKSTIEFATQSPCQRKESLGQQIDKIVGDRLASTSDSTLDRNLQESDDGKSAFLNPLSHVIDTHSKGAHGDITSTKDFQSASASVRLTGSNPSDGHLQPMPIRLTAGEKARYYNREEELSIIPEED